MSGADGDKKSQYFGKLIQLLDEYPKVFVVTADNVGSNHMQNIRRSLRGKAVVLMGKNTMIRKAIRGHLQNNEKLSALLPLVRGNIGFVFTKDDLSGVKKILTENKVDAPARAGTIAPNDVVVPAGNTGMEPTQTSFLQALNIQSKITKGQVEIINDVHLITKGAKVGSSEATLLSKLNIRPFKYGLNIKSVYDNGSVYDPKVLELSDDELLTRFKKGVKNIASIGLAIGYPTIASLPHSLARGYKNVISVSLATDFTIKQTEQMKAYLADPSKFAAATTTTTTAPAKEEKKAPAKEEKKKAPEPAPEEDDADLGGLFG